MQVRVRVIYSSPTPPWVVSLGSKVSVFMNHPNTWLGGEKKIVFQCLENPCKSLKNIMTRWRRTITKMNAKQGNCTPLSSLPQALWTGAGSGKGIGQGEEGGGGELCWVVLETQSGRYQIQIICCALRNSKVYPRWHPIPYIAHYFWPEP